MDERDRKPYVYRLRGLTIGVMLIITILGINIWNLQISQGAYYAAEAKGNYMKLVKVPPTRGDIVDKNGNILVTSVPEFVLNLDWLDLQQSKTSDWKEVVKRLAGYIKPYWPYPNQSVESITEDILVMTQNHQWERYQPVMVLDNVPQDLQAIIAEHQNELPGVSVDAVPLRSYPQKTLAGQLLGYVREIGDKEIAEFNQNEDAQKASFEYAQGDMIGKMGVEKSYDFWLRGKEGIKQVEIDNRARPVSKQLIQPPEPGMTVQLTIDADLQKVVEESLDQVIANVQKNTNPDAKSGAAVVMDVNTGKILAMASRPGMDPNDLTGIISDSMFDKYYTNKIAPAASLNRALSGLYAPGSTFKMVTAIAAFQLQLTTPDEQIDGKKSSLGNLAAQQQGTSEWGGNDFGLVNLSRALAKSSNIYFQVMGRRVFDTNPEVVRQIANEFGLGVVSGVNLPGEAKGIAPSAEWKKAYFGPTYIKARDKKLADIEADYATKLEQAPDVKSRQKLQAKKDAEKNAVEFEYKQKVYENVNWKLYDSFNNSIGQGYNSYTPLQLANYTATLVNGGKRYTLYVVDKLLNPITGEVFRQYYPKVINSVSVSPDNLDAVKQGMRAVVTGTGDDAGTAAGIFADLPEFTGGAKTGTAQLGNINTALGKSYNGVFVAFAPYDKPQIAFAGVVEFGESGGSTAGYVAKAAFMKYFGWESTNGN
ncbi:Penicillin-binding protein 2 (PBP-2) [Desulfosporosinus sp. I2]|uniref:penicillin-binding protein 2 n=1 Tax=Desulfosporosinus sp. I2 TaxID=1617025 RepID=UPI0005ED907B|nr:penicillin-binding protein 2 [Desulfosporosinus sp. I2]KJR46919.1 Penicillin-binding protein 2 (PBP-2) [Desulfosporosinus sp. I2]